MGKHVTIGGVEYKVEWVGIERLLLLYGQEAAVYDYDEVVDEQGWYVTSEDDDWQGPYDSEGDAEERLRTMAAGRES